MPGTGTLRTLAGFTDPVAAAIFERITSVDAETTLRTTVDRLRTFDLAHLQDIHRRLLGDVYEWAGQLRYIDLSKPDQTGDQLLHHPWITAYSSSAVVDQLQADANLAGQSDPGIWADRAAHYWAAMLHAHPFREGNGRSIRIWIEDVADAAGHHLRWERSSADRNVFVAAADRRRPRADAGAADPDCRRHRGRRAPRRRPRRRSACQAPLAGRGGIATPQRRGQLRGGTPCRGEPVSRELAAPCHVGIRQRAYDRAHDDARAWWVNLEDAGGNNVSEGGFLGLDNTGPIDRSHLPVGRVLEPSDATGWTAFYALVMAGVLQRSGRRPALDLVLKFLEHFAAITEAMDEQGLWDDADGLCYDRLLTPDRQAIRGVLRPAWPGRPCQARRSRPDAR